MRQLRNPMRWLALGAVVAVAAVSCGRADEGDAASGEPVPAAGNVVVEVHRSASCDCCGRYEAYLRRNGFEVRSVVDDDVAALKERLGIPGEMASCHTALIGDVFVEGHVPVEAIRRFLAEPRELDGISLPGMPAGSPGMGGTRTGPLVVYGLRGELVEPFWTSPS